MPGGWTLPVLGSSSLVVWGRSACDPGDPGSIPKQFRLLLFSRASNFTHIALVNPAELVAWSWDAAIQGKLIIPSYTFTYYIPSPVWECEQCSRLRHPNIVCFFGIYHPPDARVPSLVMERLYCSLTNMLEPGLVSTVWLAWPWMHHFCAWTNAVIQISQKVTIMINMLVA